MTVNQLHTFEYQHKYTDYGNYVGFWLEMDGDAYEVLLDKTDLYFLRYRWTLSKGGYVKRCTSRYDPSRKWPITVNLYLHREIMDLSGVDGFHIDHINRVRTDNRRENLQIVTPQVNYELRDQRRIKENE